MSGIFSPLNRLLAARALRAFGDGFVSLLLPLYLLDLGYTALQVGVIATTTLVGSGLMTLAAGLHAHRYRFRSLLLAGCALMAATGIGAAYVTAFWPLLVIAFVGTLNPSSGDASFFLPLEHALLARLVRDDQRTAAFARYSLMRSLGGAFGALAAALPAWVAPRIGWSLPACYQAMFAGYALLAVAAAALYTSLPAQLTMVARKAAAPLVKSKRHVYTLAALFSLDSFGGGFIVQSMLALWLFQAHALSPAAAGTLFFWTEILAAISYFVAVKIAARHGLLETMVFTHIPSSLCLVAIPFAPGLAWVIALLLVRAALSQMDVPTRSSYVMAIVPEAERAAAAGITAVPRSLAAAASPALAGWLLGVSPFGWPLLIGGAAKLVYDGLLYVMFRDVRPPEEQ